MPTPLNIRRCAPLLAAFLAASALAQSAPVAPVAPVVPGAAPAARADTLADAFRQLADGKGRAVLVYAHGSDWNPAGETLLRRVVATPAFLAGLPAGVVLTDVDLPEQGAAHAVRRILQRLPAASGAGTSAVKGANGSTYARQPDGSWLADAKTNPAQEVVEMTFTVGKAAARGLRLGLLADPSLPGGKSGRAGSGNFAINEIELVDDKGAKRPLRAAVADYEERAGGKVRAAAFLVDGDKQSSDRAWSVHGSDLKDQHLLLLPEADLPAGAVFTLRLHCLAPWGQHTPGRLRLDPIVFDAGLAAVAKQAQLEAANRAVQLDTTNLPALYLYGSDKRRFAALTPLRADASAAELTLRVRAALARQAEREALLAKAKAAAPAERAELLAKAALALEGDLDGESRKETLAELRKIDPQGPWLWRLDFRLNEVDKEKDRLKKEKGEQAALDYLDGVLRSPRAAKLSTSQRQELMLRKFTLVRAWKGHEEQRWDILDAIAKVDETTHYGLGARGQFNYFGRGVPTVAYGWWPRHVKAGANRLLIQEGVAVNLPSPGLYRLDLRTRDGGKDAAILRGAAFVSEGGRELSAVACEKPMDGGKNKEVSCVLNLPEGTDPAKVRLRLDVDLPKGTDHSCTLTLRPTLPEDGPQGWRK